jgi:hypothetical protein
MISSARRSFATRPGAPSYGSSTTRTPASPRRSRAASVTAERVASAAGSTPSSTATTVPLSGLASFSILSADVDSKPVDAFCPNASNTGPLATNPIPNTAIQAASTTILCR